MHRSISEIIDGQSVTTAKPSDTVLAAAERMKERNIGALLVVEGDQLVGIFTERDALYRVLAAGADPAVTKLSEVMTPNPQTITADKPFRNALHLMYENGYRHVPVVDGGTPIGVISARDALGADLIEFESDLQVRENISEILG
ncbi:MAG: CBS domain-containing protein [Rhodocyclaceae bacterium]|nr:CBS domain-containing protein [Rhodocyclaceae bacterium]